jgi:hypothetical protein
LCYIFSGCCSFDETVVAGWPISPEQRQIIFADASLYYGDDDEVPPPDEEDDDDEAF